MTLRTEYDFTLPRGYVDAAGSVHRKGVMRLATARDELEPLRNPTIAGPDDPRLTILILARVVTQLGDVPMITANEIEGLFAVDLAFLQDFYGVINFGSQQEYEALLAAQGAIDGSSIVPVEATADVVDADEDAGADARADADDADESGGGPAENPVRTRVVEVPRDKG
ncbi:MAG: hypothetical protein ABI382_03630 [Nakamurella sp.]